MTSSLYFHLPESPGVYLMRGARSQLLYVGKAGNLRRRVSSYFMRPQDARIQVLIQEIRHIDFLQTDTALEALVLEAQLIKKYRPPYNVREKDDTSFLFIEITKDVFPRVLLVRGKDEVHGVRFGPFTSASHIREALRIVRKIFTFSEHPPREVNSGRSCFNATIGLCPGVCVGRISRREYLLTIRNIILFFQGKKAELLQKLTREMKLWSDRLEFEKAERIKRSIFSLRHIRDTAFISRSQSDFSISSSDIRIEGYDIAHISGTSAVGSMVVFRGEGPAKSEYRKFRIRTLHQSHDTGMLQEMLRRRFSRGWKLPHVVLIDGGKPQVNAAREVLREFHLHIPLVGIAKGLERKKNEFIGLVPRFVLRDTLIRVRDEAHRFAQAYHFKLRAKRSFQ